MKNKRVQEEEEERERGGEKKEWWGKRGRRGDWERMGKERKSESERNGKREKCWIFRATIYSKFGFVRRSKMNSHK